MLLKTNFFSTIFFHFFFKFFFFREIDRFLFIVFYSISSNDFCKWASNPNTFKKTDPLPKRLPKINLMFSALKKKVHTHKKKYCVEGHEAPNFDFKRYNKIFFLKLFHIRVGLINVKYRWRS